MVETITSPVTIDRLGPILDQYDGLILDIWGVLHDGQKPYPSTIEALGALKALGKKVVLLSNTPGSSATVRRQLQTFGITPDLYEGIVTSGDAVRSALEEPPGHRYALFGGDDGDYAIMPKFDRVPVEQADFILANCLLDRDPRRDPQWRTILAPAAENGLPMICANPDIVVMVGNGHFYCAGALAEIYESLGGPVRAYGKPHAPVYELALAALDLPKSRVLALGDTIDTDILGANRQGIKVALVAGGILALRLLSGGKIDAASLTKTLQGQTAVPDYVLPYLAV